ncbi:MAG: NifU family protein [Candidatus Glassbacteria bacterium]|nr:NifU family protein [Candidatus Glassbacteria bacterium]
MQTRVEQVIANVRGYLQADGGDIELVEITDDNVVMVTLKGACSGCPGAAQTLKMGVERVMRQAVPEIKSVESV